MAETRQVTPIRELHLRRRRSRVPWVYAVYHYALDVPGRATHRQRRAGESARPDDVGRTITGPTQSARSGSVLAAQKRRHVEERVLDGRLF